MLLHLVLAASLAVPGQGPGTATVIAGPIDQSFLAKFKALTPGQQVVVSSPGGDAYIGLQVADAIREKSLKVVVAGICISVCAEIILPAASRYGTLSFYGEPIIAYHHNIAIIKDEFTKVHRTDFDSCFGGLYRRFKKLRDETHTNFGMWKAQEAVLDLHPGENEKKVACNDFKVEHQHREWLPSSAQLRQLFGLRFKGVACADDPKCYLRAIGAVVESSDSFIIGSKCVAISKAGDNIKFSNCPLSPAQRRLFGVRS